ncbi:MAG: cyclic nucleotide-binding domain-containing protein [Gemmataceae bacterium]|nr:cyclic nucleotide-binding domain-containing protein [Gemmataceae bacterium]
MSEKKPDPPKKDQPQGPPVDVSWADISLSEMLRERSEDASKVADPPAPKKPDTTPVLFGDDSVDGEKKPAPPPAKKPDTAPIVFGDDSAPGETKPVETPAAKRATPMIVGDDSFDGAPISTGQKSPAAPKPPAKKPLPGGNQPSFAELDLEKVLTPKPSPTKARPRDDMMSLLDISLSDSVLQQIAKRAPAKRPDESKPRDDMSFADFALQEIEQKQELNAAAAIAAPPAPAPAPPPEKPAEKVKEVAVNREAMLEPRRKDVQIPVDKLVAFRDCIGLFSQLKNKPSVEKWPGTLVLRRYHPGEPVFRQGEAGMSAFYVLTAADEDRLRAAKLIPPQRTMIDLETSAEALAVHLAIARPVVKQESWVDRLANYFVKKPEVKAQPKFIPIDAPVGVEYESRRAVLSAGDLFGEMSCLYRTPRSATVVAERDCYVVELLRNVLDQLKKDPKFKEEMDKKYKERVFGLQVLNLPIFRGLNEELITWLRDKATLKSYRAGQVVCDEHDRPDDMMIIRGGLVKVCQGVSNLYGRSDVLSWTGLAAKLVAAAEGTPLARVRATLGPSADERLANEAHDPTALSADQWQEVLYELNDLVKGPPLGETDAALAGPQYKLLLATLPKAAKDRSESDARRLNRTFLDELLGGAVRAKRLSAGPESILQYASRGDLIGEMGVAMNRPRSASCLAYTHPRFGQALEDVKSTEEETVEVVLLPAAAFRELLDKPGAESVRAHVEQLISTRQRSDLLRQKLAPGSDSGRRLSPEFEKLGLIQGQKLMLIDLDRCTRCDECVRACADVHSDGRSRLFLEGPRFERYLVPITCRSCLDPVCLIGCPVGSIHRGDNKQITIEDWCIGCGLCARQCPYGSILLHDIGLIANGAREWSFNSGEVDPTKRPGIAHWPTAAAPFRLSRDFRSRVKPSTVYWFARTFDVPADLLRDHVFEMELTGLDPAAQIYINGTEVATKERLKKDKRAFPIAEPEKFLRAKNNMILVRVSPKEDEAGVIFDLRLDASPRPVRAEGAAIEYTEKAVTSRAVVCDLCSNLPGQVPSCVNACPHDAAMRVDARTGFPTR